MFSCCICGEGLKNDSCYCQHMVCIHILKHTCDLCGKDFSSPMGLKITAAKLKESFFNQHGEKTGINPNFHSKMKIHTDTLSTNQSIYWLLWPRPLLKWLNCKMWLSKFWIPNSTTYAMLYFLHKVKHILKHAKYQISNWTIHFVHSRQM